MTPDENSAPYVAPDIGATCYHCPNTTCDGHLYLSMAELGRELACPKCGLMVTIGPQKVMEVPLKAKLPERQNALSSKLLLLALGILIGFVLTWASMHF
jgi:hypothetical protein